MNEFNNKKIKNTTKKYYKKMCRATQKQFLKAIKISENDIFESIKILQMSLNTNEKKKEIFFSYIYKKPYKKKNFSYLEIFDVFNKHHREHRIKKQAIIETYKELISF